jgi:hypothetical protein
VEVCESLLIEIRDILKQIKINIGGAWCLIYKFVQKTEEEL